MLGRKNTLEKCPSSHLKPIVNISKIVKDACSVYIEKGRFHSTASKLTKTKNKCTRIAR